MNFIRLQIISIAIVTGIACVLPGTFLILRNLALLSDAISHAILPGIVIMFLFVKHLDSPLLIIGAALSGIATVIVTERIIATKRIGKDTAIGLVFPVFFSVGILLTSHFARTVHLDVDMVILGELVFAPFERLFIGGYDLGPHALWTMSTIALINCTLVYLLYKELRICTFDPITAHMVGIQPHIIHYLIIIMTSITAVGAFHVAGSIVVVALMLAPPAAAYLISPRLSHIIIIGCLFSVLSVLCGYTIAHLADVSIAGSIACACGIIFFICFITSPHNGLLAHYLHKRKERYALCAQLVLAYKKKHGEQSATKLSQQFGWNQSQTKKILHYAQQQQKSALLDFCKTYDQASKTYENKKGV